MVVLVWGSPVRADSHDETAADDVSRARVEFGSGPVTGPARVVGMGGAYASVAEGLGGLTFNPASLGCRRPNAKRWWAVDGTFGVSILPLDRSADYENDGYTNVDVDRHSVLVMGAMAQIDFLGIGWQWNDRTYRVASSQSPDNKLNTASPSTSWASAFNSRTWGWLWA